MRRVHSGVSPLSGKRASEIRLHNRRNFFVGELFNPSPTCSSVRGCCCAKLLNEFFEHGTI